MEDKVRQRFPQKELQVALDQQLQTGVIFDNLGAQSILIDGSISGATTGSALHDDILLQIQPIATQAATQPLQAEVGAFQEEFTLAANKATNTAYNTGIFETLNLIAQDPEFADFNLSVALANPQSALYGGIGKFNISNLVGYFGKLDDGRAKFARFQNALTKYLPVYAQQAFAYKGNSPEGSVLISSINNQIFGNQPTQNFVTNARAIINQKGQAEFSGLRLVQGIPTIR